jgi:hypothetical protein
MSQGMVIYAIGCAILGLTFISLGDTFLGIAVCACGPLWLIIQENAHHSNTDDEEDYEND